MCVLCMARQREIVCEDDMKEPKNQMQSPSFPRHIFFLSIRIEWERVGTKDTSPSSGGPLFTIIPYRFCIVSCIDDDTFFLFGTWS